MEERPLLELLELVQEREDWNKKAGETLRQARVAAGLSQSQLAAAADKTQPYVSSVENGNGTSTDTLRHFHGVIEAHATGGGTTSATTDGTQGRSQAKAHAAQARKRGSKQRA